MHKLTVPAIAVALAAAVSVPLVARAAASPTAATAIAQGKLDDPTIVAIFDEANTADIETGQLAAKRGHSKEVRDLGATFAQAHTGVRQQGRDLAKKLGVAPTPPKPDQGAQDHANVMAMLRSKHGADFDKAFLEHEVAFHKAVIDAVNTTLLPAIQNAELKQLVTNVGPAFQAHLIAAQSLEQKLFPESKASN